MHLLTKEYDLIKENRRLRILNFGIKIKNILLGSSLLDTSLSPAPIKPDSLELQKCLLNQSFWKFQKI